MEPANKRTPFRYKSDADELLNRDATEGIDEQEQEKLISSLSRQDQATTAFYRGVVMALPALTIAYLFVVLSFGPSAGGAAGGGRGSAFMTSMVYVLSAVSLLISLAIAWRIPVSAAAAAARARREEADPAAVLTALGIPVPQGYGGVVKGVLDQLVFVNAGACVLVCLAVVTADSGPSVWFMAIPVLLCFAVVAVARNELQPVDIPSLERLKYTYKGA